MPWVPAERGNDARQRDESDGALQRSPANIDGRPRDAEAGHEHERILQEPTHDWRRRLLDEYRQTGIQPSKYAELQEPDRDEKREETADDGSFYVTQQFAV